MTGTQVFPGRTARGIPPAAVPVLLCLALLSSIGCGRKTPVKPPALVAPEAITQLEAANEGEGIRLRWERPGHYADGSLMRDLAGFRVERSRDTGAFVTRTMRTVSDRDRFRQIRRFRFLDTRVIAGERYRYRVFGFTLDEHVSVPSNLVDIVRVIPPDQPPALPGAVSPDTGSGETPPVP